MRRWLPAPLVSASLLLMWLMLNQTVHPAHWLLGSVLAVLVGQFGRLLAVEVKAVRSLFQRLEVAQRAGVHA